MRRRPASSRVRSWATTAGGLLRRAGRLRRPALHRPRRPAPGQRGQGPGGYRFFDLPTIRRGTSFAEDEGDGDGELRDRLRAAYLAEWAAFEPPDRLARAWELAAPLGALHQAVSYQSFVARQQPPIETHMARSTAWWLRRVLAGLAELGTAGP